MDITEAVAMAGEVGPDLTLVAKPPFSWGAEAAFVKLTDEGRVPADPLDGGFQYLLSIDDMSDLLAHLGTKRISPRAAAEFVVHYAVYDCAPAWIEDIPSL